MDMYGPEYNDYSPYAATYGYSKIWAEEINITGSDGGSFGPRIKKDDILPVYVSSILRYGELEYNKSQNYHELDVWKFTIADYILQTEESYPENSKWFQNKNGYNGFFNISAQLGGPCFVSFPHCYACEQSARDGLMEYHEWSNSSTLGPRIYPNVEHDESFAKVEPYTGTSVSVVLNFEIVGAIYKDYFYQNIYEAVEGKGLYLPYYQLLRSYNFTDSKVHELFGSFMMAQKLRVLVFYIGITIGALLILVSFFNCAYLYRKKKFGTGWKSPKLTLSPSSSPRQKILD